ncbi:type VI immunity family protein [Paracoccus sp. Ld10]|uniref:type VI immunity family protein n=1 Tax=Paracoccus sp. Ld10 TaxID=649158 RepID=UPI00386CBA3A
MTPEMLRTTRDIDDVRILSPQGDETARIVFKLVLFFEGGNTLEGQLNALTALADLAEDVAPHLAFMQCAGDTARPEQFDLIAFRQRSEQAIRKRHTAGLSASGIDLGLFGAEFRPPNNTGVTPFGGSVIAGGGLEGTADISVLEFSTSLFWDAQTMFRRHAERARKAASTLRASFGMAGFALQYDRIYASTAGTYPYLARFPGLHCGLDDRFAAELSVRRQRANRYFSLNWLTLLSDDLLAELVPAEQLQQHLGDSIPISRFDGGIIIQAGQHPQLGDVNQGLILQDYRAVNAAIRNLRFESYIVPVLDAPEPLDALEATLEWVRRYD